jgi:membrane protease YdiL (CAAX protease family)
LGAGGRRFESCHPDIIEIKFYRKPSKYHNLEGFFVYFISKENKEYQGFYALFYTLFFLLMVVVIVPFIEELLFRLYLRFKDNNLTHFVILLASVTGKVNKHKIKTFYFSAIMFALFHLSNYELNSLVFFLSPILIAPQFIAGLFLGYLRIKYNLFVGYFMHAIHNGLLMGYCDTHLNLVTYIR